MSSQYNELRPTSGLDKLASLGHPSKFQRVSRLGSVTARHSSSGLQPNLVAWYKEWNYGTFPEGATYIFDWAAITFVTGPHCSITVNYGRPA